MGSQQHQHHNESSCSSGPDSPRHPHSHTHSLHGGGGVTAGASSAGVGSVTGAMSKELPLDTSSSGGGGASGSQGRAQYLSATCVVFTNYSGDTASVVDEHFSRALNYSNKETKGRFAQLIGMTTSPPPLFDYSLLRGTASIYIHRLIKRTAHVMYLSQLSVRVLPASAPAAAPTVASTG